MFEQMSHIESNGIISVHNCSFCNHPARASAEEKYEQTGSFSMVEKLFKTFEQEEPLAKAPTYQCVRNHILKHYQQQEKQLWLKAYSGRVLEMMNYKIDQDKKLESLAAQMELKLFDIASDPTVCPLKQADAMTKLAKMMLEITTLQAKLRGDLDNVTILTEKFTDVWTNVIGVQKNDHVKKILLDALDAFQSGISVIDAQASTATGE